MGEFGKTAAVVEVSISELVVVGRDWDVGVEGLLVRVTDGRRADLLIGFIKTLEGTCN